MTRARNLGKLANTNTLSADNVNNFVGIASTQPTTRLNVVGVVSATSFSGDGSSLTGVASTDNIITGTAATFNNVVKVGTAITLDATSGIITATKFVGPFEGELTGSIDATTGSFSGDVTLQANLDLQDNDKILLGTGDDLQIFHDGSNSIIQDDGTGSLFLKTNEVQIEGGSGENMIIAQAGAATTLFHNNNKKLETTSDGVTVTGTIDGQTELRTWLFG